MSEIIVRPIAEGDLEATIEILIAGSLSPDGEDRNSLSTYRTAVTDTRSRGGEVLVAVREGDVVGLCQLIIFRHFQHAGGWCGEIESVHVRAEYRSHGVGAAMLRAAEELARDRGCYRVQLTSNAVRADAHRFYLSNGYQLTHQGFRKSLVAP